MAGPKQSIEETGRTLGKELRQIPMNISRETAAAGRGLGLDDTVTSLLLPNAIPAVLQSQQERAASRRADEEANRIGEEAAAPERERIKNITNFLNALSRQKRQAPGRQQLLLGGAAGEGPLLTPMSNQ